MNTLPRKKQLAVVSDPIEGGSIRSVERIAGVHRDTIMRVLRRTGENCERTMDREMRDLGVHRVEADELWTFCHKKVRRLNDAERLNPDMDDQYLFIALDPESKLVPSFAIRKREQSTAIGFMVDLAARVGTRTRILISTDAFQPYRDAIELAVGLQAGSAQIVKTYASENPGPGRYSPPKVSEVVSTVISADPGDRWISTSHIKRWNLSMRTACWRFTRLSVSYSRNMQDLRAAVALAITAYNFVKVHRSLRMTPAMGTGVANRTWEVGDLV